jgi:hypothetical protein
VTTTGGPPSAENPFSTRHIRPGATPFFFPPNQSAEGLVESLRKHGWRGEIVGPHGSGKSSLVSALIPAIRSAGRTTLLVELHDGQRRMPVDLRRAPDLGRDAVVIVDGYEQLSFWSRARLRWFCRHRGLGLLVTTHKPAGFPPLFRTATSLALAEQIVQFLLGGQPPLVDSGELARRFERHRGDLRELLFDLYDVYEERGGAQP